jgi:hypothetical protein
MPVNGVVDANLLLRFSFMRSESGTFVLKGVDELQTLLDEHITTTQQIAFSAFKKPFAERIDT